MDPTVARKKAKPQGPVHVRSAFVELSSWNAKDLYRNKKGLFSILFMFLFFLALIVLLNFAINYGNRPEPVVVVSGDYASVEKVIGALAKENISATTGESAEIDSKANVHILVGEDQALITLNSVDSPRWIALAATVSGVGYEASNVKVVDDAGSVMVDLLRENLAGVVAIGFMAITFMGTSVPLVALRQKGTLRLLGTTPVRKLTFIAAQTPVRFALGAVVSILLVSFATALGYLDFFQVLRLAFTLFLGLTMFFAFAYLLASRSRNTEFISQISALIPIFALFASGSVLPKGILPDWVAVALNLLPTTWFIQAAGNDLVGVEGFTSVYVLWAMMICIALCSAALAARLFVWDDRER
ncbi:MAG: ABC transporter permease [Pseudoclavibacter sp.]